MKYILSYTLLILFLKPSFSQEVNNYPSEEKEEKFNYISFGWSNPISLTRSILIDDLNEKLGLYLDYSLNIEENKLVKIHIKTSPFYATQKLTLENFLASIDYIKLITLKDKYILGHGAGTYFRCNIYRSQPVAGLQTFWSSDFFGIGLQYHVFLDYELKDDLWINESPVSPNQLAGIISLIQSGDISGKIAKELFEIVYSEGGDPEEIVEKRGMKQVTDTSAIEQSVEKVINDNPDQVAKAKINPKLAGWFVGQVMKATGGKANPKSVNEIVSKKLNL